MSSSADVEASMLSWGVAFGSLSLLTDEACLNPLCDKGRFLQPLCSVWEACTSALLEGACSNLVLIDLECL